MTISPFACGGHCLPLPVPLMIFSILYWPGQVTKWNTAWSSGLMQSPTSNPLVAPAAGLAAVPVAELELGPQATSASAVRAMAPRARRLFNTAHLFLMDLIDARHGCRRQDACHGRFDTAPVPGAVILCVLPG